MNRVGLGLWCENIVKVTPAANRFTGSGERRGQVRRCHVIKGRRRNIKQVINELK